MTNVVKPLAALSTPVDTLGALLQKSLQTAGHLTAFSQNGINDPLTYAGLASLAAHFAEVLEENQVVEGDRVIFLTKNHVLFFPLLFATAARKAILVPLNPEWTPSELETVILDSEAKVVFLEKQGPFTLPTRSKARVLSMENTWAQRASFVAKKFAFDPATPGATPALIIYTSGTSGHSKGVVLTQENLSRMAQSISTFYGFRQDDRFLSVLPFYHINAPVVTGLACLAVGAQVHLSDLFGFASAKYFWKTVADRRISVLSLTPTIMATLLRLFPEGPNARLAAVRFALVGTARLEPKLWMEFEKTIGVPCYQGYGLTETTTWATMTPPDSRKRYDSAGIPVDCKIKIDREYRLDGTTTVKEGEVLIKGPLVMSGYYHNKKLTRQLIVDGWFRTGDLGFIDEDEQLVICGRTKNIIKRNGVLILPEEIDSILSRHASVTEAKTMGLADPIAGERVVSVVCTETGEAVLSEIRSHLAGFLNASKLPDEILISKKLPRNPIGKIDQKKLLEILNGDLCAKVVEKFDRYEYRRAHSDSMPEVLQLVQACLVQGRPIRFVGYWGAGGRTEKSEADILALDRIKHLVDSINELCQSETATAELILADIHGKCNGVPEAAVQAYFAEIKKLISERNIAYSMLSSVWTKAGLSFEQAVERSNSEDFKKMWATFDLRETFLRQARNRTTEEAADAAARRYYSVCTTERAAVASQFAGSLFFTYAEPKHQSILPELPLLYWHSVKPGVAEKPWFL